MKSFLGWLYETVKKGPFGYEHEAKIGGRRLGVSFAPLLSHSDESKNKYSVSYDVNGQFNKVHMDKKPPETKEAKAREVKDGAAVVRHVGNVIGGFLKEKNPHSLYMRGDTPAKHRMYGRFLKKMVRTHGGHATEDQKHHIWTREPYESPKQ